MQPGWELLDLGLDSCCFYLHFAKDRLVHLLVFGLGLFESKFTILTQLPSAVHSPISPQTSLLSLLISRTYDLKIGMNNPY